MLIARRLYLYLISFISLMMMLVGGANLLKLLLERWLGTESWYIGYNEYFRREFSLWGAILLVGTVVWVIHWIMAQKSVAPVRPEAAQERGSVLRKLMIYAVLFVTLWQVLFAADELLSNILLNIPEVRSNSLRDSFNGSFPLVLVFGLAWFYYWWVRRADNQVQPEQEGSATVRRWYFYLACYGALSLLIYHTAELLYNIWLVATSDYVSVDVNWIPGPIAYNLAWVLVALPVWLWHWVQTQRMTASLEDEQHSILRKLYIYLMIVQTVAVTLVSLAFFMYHMLRFILGSSFENAPGGSLLSAAGLPFCNALVYGVFWAFYSQILNWDTALIAKEPPLQANLRRLYHHLVALVSLIVLSIGIARLVRILLDLWLGGDVTNLFNRDAWSNEISLFTTLILAGGTVWYFSWAHLQKKALAPDGAGERKAIFRRIYLYLVIFLSVVTLLGSTAWLIYQIFLIIGKPITGELISEMSWALGATATGTLMLVYHLRIMLGDLKAKAPVAAPEPSSQSQPVLLFVEGSNLEAVAERLASIKAKLPPGCGLELIPAADLTLPELKYWLSAREDWQTAKDEREGPKPVAVG